MKISHPILDSKHVHLRSVFQSLSQEDGMLYMIDKWLPSCANIQISWLEADELLIRYEDLLKNDLAILESALLEHCGLPVEHDRFREVVMACRFERLTHGRARGKEDVQAHERKGVAGDFQNHLTKKVKHMHSRIVMVDCLSQLVMSVI